MHVQTKHIDVLIQVFKSTRQILMHILQIINKNLTINLNLVVYIYNLFLLVIKLVT
jgi:hypothetical protein